ncbi:MAG: LysR family transcriptional regulator [Gemmatimonadales bacterium]
MELRHLRYFEAVAREGGFARAGARLRVAQPALSRQIRSLEKELGTELVERLPRGIRLTPTGEVLHRGLSRVLERTTAAVERTRLAGRGLSGRCRLGAGKVVLWSGIVSRVVALLSKSFPHIDLDLVEMEGPDQWYALRDGMLDLGVGLGFGPEEQHLASEPLLDSSLDCALLAADHPLAVRDRLSPADLAGMPLLVLTSTAGLAIERQLLARLESAGFDRVRLQHHPTLQSVWTLCAAGRGWSLASRQWGARTPPGTVAVPIRKFSLPLELVLMSREGESHPAVLSVQEVFRAVRDGRAPHVSEVTGPVRAVRRRKEPASDPTSALELRHLRYFQALAEEGAFGRAAKRLGITQPALSRQVKDLERMVETPLVRRAARGVQITPAGEVLRAEVHEVDATVDRLLSEIRAAHRGMKRECVVGAVTTPITLGIIPRALRLLEHRGAAIEVAVFEILTPDQPAALRAGRIDLGICHAFPALAPDPSIGHTRLLDEAIEAALLGVNHPLAGRSSIQAAELAEVPFLFMPRRFHPTFYDRVFATFGELGLAPRVDRTFEGLGTVWALVAQGEGWGLGFHSQLINPPAGTVAVPVAGLRMPWGLEMLWRREDTNPLVPAVVEALKQARGEGPAN